MTTIAPLKKIQVLGVTTDFNMCECCGKTDLSKTVSILDLESGITLHFGIVCAAKADKYDTLQAAKEAKKEITKAVTSFNSILKSAHILTFGTLRKVYGVVTIEQGIKVNCDQSIYDDCYKQAVAHLQTDRLKRFEYKGH